MWCHQYFFLDMYCFCQQQVQHHRLEEAAVEEGEAEDEDNEEEELQ